MNEQVFHAVTLDAFIVLAALAIVCLFGAPMGPGIAAPVQRIISRVCRRGGGRDRSPTLHSLLRRSVREALPAAGARAIAEAAGCVLLLSIPGETALVGGRFDIGFLLVAAATLLKAASLADPRSAGHSAHAAARALWMHLPAAGAVTSVVVAAGSLNVQEIERSQGGLPWDWMAFRSPAGLVGLGALLSCALFERGARAQGFRQGEDLAPLLEEERASAERRLPAWSQAAERTHRLLIAGLASLLFLGGRMLPGLSAVEQGSTFALELAGAACLLTKVWTLVVVIVWMRWALPQPQTGQQIRGGGGTPALWPPLLCAISAALAPVWVWWGPTPRAQLAVSASLVVAVALAGVALVHRIRHGLSAAGADVHLSPFL